MLRKLLRSLIGWNEMESRLDIQEAGLRVVVTRSEEQGRRIDLIAYKRSAAPQRDPDLDWEAQQVAFLNDPENFKEVN
jgi:hypothetical protein